MKLRNLARVAVYDQEKKKILLVRNKGANFWYLPGGGWEYDRETIVECAKREVKEETGLDVEITRFLYIQEFHASTDTICFETFWLGSLTDEQELQKNHFDLDPQGLVEEAGWFSQDDLKDLKIFPKRLKDSFWENITFMIDSEDRFIGVS
jgi:ADP-ribose pyrophosphatase YjhB (NUDIX family)